MYPGTSGCPQLVETKSTESKRLRVLIRGLHHAQAQKAPRSIGVRRGCTVAQDEDQQIVKTARITKRWKWGLGIAAGLFLIAMLKPDEAGKEYAVPATVETPSEISKRLSDAVPASIEQARAMAYEGARINWGANKAGSPSDSKVALAIQMVDSNALTDPKLADPKLRLSSYTLAITVIHCNNPSPCGYK